MNKSMKNPYVGPRTFEESERDRFFGREREARELLALVVSEQLVLFYAQSGAGKSSLINTCLTPDLKKKGFKMFPVVRVGGDAPAGVKIDNIYVFNLIRTLSPDKLDPAALAKMSLSEFLANYSSASPSGSVPGEEKPASKRRVLVIDQFEELFSSHHEEWEKRGDFFSQLAQALEDDPYLWVILVMREDYIASLDPYARLLPGKLRTRYYMQRLSREAALKAVKKPVESLRPFAEGVAEKLVEDLCSIKVQKPDGTLDNQPGQYVEPVQLQVVCHGLWENLPPEGQQITEKDLQDVGDVNQSLGKYYEGRVSAVAQAKNVRERLIREWFEEKLIAAGGIRNMVLQEPNKKSGGLDDEVIQALQSDLVRAEKRGGATWYELTHDRLVEPVLESNKNWFDKNLSPLQRQAALWKDQDQNESWLLSDHALAEVEGWAKDHQDELTDTEREFLEACRKLQAQIEEGLAAERRELEMANKLAAEQARSAARARRFNIVSIVLVVIAFFAVVYAVGQARESAKNLVIANKSREEAQVLANTARARELASRANDEMNSSLDLSMLLSVEAYNVPVENRDAQSVLFNNGQRSTRLRGFLSNALNPISQFRFSPNGKFLAALRKDDQDYKHLILWDLEQDLQSGQDLGSSAVSQFFFSTDNKFLVFLNQDGINFWDLEKNAKKDPINGHVGEVTRVIYADDKTFATLGENGDVIQWDAVKAEPRSSAQRGTVAVFSPDGKKFALFEVDKITVKDNTDQSTETIERKPYSVISMAFSQDGKVLAIADRDGSIEFWDLVNNKGTGNTFTPRHILPGATAPISLTIEMMAFNPNGNIVVVDAAYEILIFDGKSEDKINNAAITGSAPKFSPDGNTLSVLNSNKITLYSTEKGMMIGKSPLSGSLAEFSWDGKTLAIFDKESKKIGLVNTLDGTPIGDLSQDADSAPVSGMAFSREGNLLAVGAEDGSITIWDVNSKTVLQSDPSSSGQITSLAFSPDGRQLIAGRRNSKISVWNLSEARAKNRETRYRGKIASVNFAPDGSFLYSIANDGVAFFDMKTLTAFGETLPGDNLRFVADNQALAVFDSKEGRIILWDTSSRKKIGETIQGTLVQFSPKERVLETSDKDEKITLWNTLTGAKLAESSDKTVTYLLQDDFVFALNENMISHFVDVPTGASREGLIGQKYFALSPKYKVLITSNVTGQFDLWDTSTGERLGNPIKFKDEQNPSAYYFSPSENILITQSASVAGKLDLWKIATGESLGEPIDGGGTVMYNQQDGTSQFVLFNRDETRLITRSDSIGVNILWDLAAMKKIGEPLPANIQKISPDGQTLILGDYYSNTSFRDFKSGKLIGEAMDGYYSSAFFSADDRILAIRSDYNGSVALWDMVDMKPIGKPISGNFVDISADGRTLVMGNYSGEVTLWDTTTGKQVGSSIRGVSGPIGNTTLDPQGRIQVVLNEGATKEESYIDLQGMGSEKYLYSNSQDALIISPDEETFVIFSSDGGLTLWSIDTAVMPDSTVKSFDGAITGALLSPDGKTLAAASKDGIALWNPANDSLRATIPNSHIKEATDLYLSPDHKILITSNKDGDLSIRDVGTGKQQGDPIHAAFCGFSPDGRIFVTAASSYTNSNYLSSYTYSYYCSSNSGASMSSLWDTSTGKQIGEPFIGGYTFSADGRLINMPSPGGSEFKILKIATGAQGVELVQVGDPIPGVFQYFVAGSEFVISGDADGIYKLWKTDTGLEKRVGTTLPTSNLWSSSPDGKSAVFYTTVFDDKTGSYIYTYTYYLWNLKELQQIAKIEKLTGYLVVSPNGAYAYMVGTTSAVKGDFTIWDLRTGTSKTIQVEGNLSSFSPDDKYLITTDDSGDTSLINIYNAATGEKIGNSFTGSFWGFAGSNSEVIMVWNSKEGGYLRYNVQTGNKIGEVIRADSITLSPDGQTLVSYNSQGISLWRTAEPDQIGKTIPPGQLIGFSADGKMLAATSTSNEGLTEISFWDTNSGDQHGETFTYPGTFTGIRVSGDKNLISIFGNEGIFAWDLTDPDRGIPPIIDASGEADRMVFSPDGKTLAAIGNDGIILWDLSKPEPAASPLITGATGRIADVAFKDNKTLVYVDVNNSFFKQDIATAGLPTEPEETPKIPGNACRISLSPHGETLAYRSGKKLHVWNVDGDSEFPDLGESRSISCYGPMAFSADGNRLAYSEGNRITVYTFDKEGKVVKNVELTGDNAVSDLMFVNDTILAATGGDGRVFLWDIDARASLGTFDQPGQAASFADGKLQIYLPPEKRLIQINFEADAWQSLLKKWQTDLCIKAGRVLTADEWQQYFPDSAYPANPSCPMPQPTPNAQ